MNRAFRVVSRFSLGFSGLIKFGRRVFSEASP